MQEQIRDIPGAFNISDDVIVFGATKEKHDKTLHATCKQFHSGG